MSATLAYAIFDFVVGEHGSQCRAPIHDGICQVGQAIMHEDELLLLVVHAFPIGSREFTFEVVAKKELLLRDIFMPVGVLRGIHAIGAVGFEFLDECINVLCAVGVFIKPRIENLSENPLGPLVIFRIACAHFAVPIIGKPDAVELLTVSININARGDFRMLAGLNSVLFGRQPETVIPHGMQHIKPSVAFVTGNNVAGDIT